MRVAMILFLGLLAGVNSTSCSHEGRSEHVSTGTRESDNQARAEIQKLLRQAIVDWEHRTSINKGLGSHTGQFAGAKFWYSMYPLSYAEEKLIVRGMGIRPALLEIATDPSQPLEIRTEAWKVLESARAPDILKAGYAAVLQGKLGHDVYGDWRHGLLRSAPATAPRLFLVFKLLLPPRPPFPAMAAMLVQNAGQDRQQGDKPLRRRAVCGQSVGPECGAAPERSQANETAQQND